MRDADIIVCHEKHGTYYWNAQTREAWVASALAILTERWHDGYWYPNPDSDGLGDSEWAQNERAELAKAQAMTDEEIERLPKAARKQIHQIVAEAKRDSDEDREHRAWYERAEQVVEQQDTSLITIGRNKWARQVPLAWQLLDLRSDHEYERVELVEFSTPRPLPVAA